MRTLKKGQCFGAIEFFTGNIRSYNVRTKSFTSLLKISRQDFLKVYIIRSIIILNTVLKLKISLILFFFNSYNI